MDCFILCPFLLIFLFITCTLVKSKWWASNIFIVNDKKKKYCQWMNCLCYCSLVILNVEVQQVQFSLTLFRRRVNIDRASFGKDCQTYWHPFNLKSLIPPLLGVLICSTGSLHERTSHVLQRKRKSLFMYPTSASSSRSSSTNSQGFFYPPLNVFEHFRVLDGGSDLEGKIVLL